MTAISTPAAIRRAFTVAPVLGRRLWLTVLLNLGGTVVRIAIPVIIQQTVDRFVSSGGSVDVAGVLTAVAIGMAIVVVGGVMTRAGLVMLVRNSSAGLSDLRVGVFGVLMRRSVLHVQTERRGALVSRVTSDIATLQEFMEWGGVSFMVNGTQVIGALAAMLVYDWRLALLVLGGIVVYAASLVWFQRVLQRKYDAVRARVADSLAVMSEAVTALPEVRAYGAEAATLGKVHAALDERFTTEYRTARFGNVLFATSELFAAALTAAVIAAGLLLGPEQGVTAGVLLAFLFLVNLLVEPVQSMVEILDFAQNAASGLRRVVEAFDAPVEVAEAVSPVPLPPGPLDVEFDGVGFRYPTGTEVLSGVDVAVAAGRRVAVVGETGSGKTTFAKLLVRLLDPTSGVVRIGGIDVRDVEFASLRHRVAFVPQEGFLFTGTVAANVRYGEPEASDRELETAFLELGLDRWLAQLDGGLAAPVGERGAGLSAGERQIVALVRAWISTPDLLVLDEATSAVDPALDVALRRAIDRLTAGRTSVTIAHRLATAEAADEVLVFDRGRLVERGGHADLVAAGGVYAALYADWSAGTAAM